jgi:uncharacterized protein (DUF736 family)
MANTTQKTTEKKESNLKQIFAVWKQKARSGRTYLSGKDIEDVRVTGFYNTNKKNPKEPDVRFYLNDSEGKRGNNPFCSMWSNKSEKTGKTYLSGKLDDGQKVVGFVYQGTNEKAPYLTVYLSDTHTEDQEEPKNIFEQQAEQNMKKDSEPETDEDLPF